MLSQPRRKTEKLFLLGGGSEVKESNRRLILLGTTLTFRLFLLNYDTIPNIPSVTTAAMVRKLVRSKKIEAPIFSFLSHLTQSLPYCQSVSHGWRTTCRRKFWSSLVHSSEISTKRKSKLAADHRRPSSFLLILSHTTTPYLPRYLEHHSSSFTRIELKSISLPRHRSLVLV